MAEEVKLMKGNEAIAHAAIRYGADGYFGYPITRNRKSWKLLWKKSRGKRPAWLCCKPRAK